ncbi:putative DNA modification/repair radical SAM protein [Aminivibrio sp.]|jgi:putative DNA modification/repair radical SAM protein|uniref:putative DNA modification/repair radical SAM protein n=1 Tax=Aminivibrio sp. TaxID=1872489 RepID=UPI001A5833C3|nr:putative DNA modification/repair radical SAM protein [Aminivibrio sp.]MBL3539896.1 putative DNA modification/repair radical SAM protein [Aminivibrio sp.]
METLGKLAVLAEGAKYDVSCSSSGSAGRRGSLGSTSLGGICHSWSDDGRCISLLKVLFSNDCVFDCAYCVNRRSADIPRATFTPRELADLTIRMYRRNYIEGLFLSSAVVGSPDDTMVQLVRTAKILREEHRFGGYIHAKAIPGASPSLLGTLGLLADRMSVNIELPSEQSLLALAPQKNRDSILRPMAFIGGTIEERKKWKRTGRPTPAFVPAGQSTQLMVGASPENDFTILRLSEGLYRSFGLRRVYYSAYIPVADNPLLPAPAAKPPLLREHRLYQADWLLRFYGFRAEEVLSPQQPNLDEALDPKTGWALARPDFFPVDVNRASYEEILRVPGIGVRSAKRILTARRGHLLDGDDLAKLGIVMKRARFFISCKNPAFPASPPGGDLRRLLSAPPPGKDNLRQLRMEF